jgi:hypothetical protein
MRRHQAFALAHEPAPPYHGAGLVRALVLPQHLTLGLGARHLAQPVFAVGRRLHRLGPRLGVAAQVEFENKV